MPQGPTSPDSEGVGGSEVSGAGVLTAFRVRTDSLLEVLWRFTEAEWPAVLAMVEYGQDGGIINLYPDQALSTNHTCYLDSPRLRPGERVKPSRSTHMGHMEVRLVFRRTTQAPFGAQYFTS